MNILNPSEFLQLKIYAGTALILRKMSVIPRNFFVGNSMTAYLCCYGPSLVLTASFYNISITELYIVNNLYVLHVFFNLIYSCNDKHLSEQLCVLEMSDNILLFRM